MLNQKSEVKLCQKFAKSADAEKWQEKTSAMLKTSQTELLSLTYKQRLLKLMESKKKLRPAQSASKPQENQSNLTPLFVRFFLFPPALSSAQKCALDLLPSRLVFARAKTKGLGFLS